jgi:hypothetical protein
MDYHFQDAITKDRHSIKLEKIIERGNHKLAEKGSKHLLEGLEKDVTHGLSMPILLTIVKQIRGAMAQAFRLAEQLSLLESRKPVSKYWLTQDLSFSLTNEKISLNAQIDMDAYVKMIYSAYLKLSTTTR